MTLPLDRSTACLAIWMLATTGCVSTLDIDAVPSEPAQMQSFAPEALPYPDAATLAGDGPMVPYRAGALDEISVRVFGRPDLGSQAEGSTGVRSSIVGQDGLIHLPLIGPVEVVGRTRSEIADLVSARYSRVVENAQVEVQIVRCGSQPVDLVGALVEPGRFYLCENLRTVGDVVGAAGGVAPEANPMRGTLSRGGSTFSLYPPVHDGEGDTRFDVPLNGGDIINFPAVAEQQVFVFGQVSSPGPYPIPPQGLTIVELLAMAEGWSEQTTAGSVYLLRPTNEMVVAYEIDLSEVLQGPGVPLRAGDRLYIAPTLLTRWAWWWRQALPSFFIPRYSF